MEVSIQRLACQSEESKKFRLLTNKRFRCCLEGIDPDGVTHGTMIVIGAYLDKEPIGLALATQYGLTGPTEVFSLYVKEEYRHHGIGEKLLKRIEQEGVKEGGNHLVFLFHLRGQCVEPFKKLLKKLNWSDPEIFHEQYLGNAYSYHEKWISNPPKLPKGYSIFPWSKLTKQEKETIDHQMSQGWFGPGVYPFRDEETIEPLNSLGLRWKDEVVGWLITNRIAPDVIRYSSLYLQKDHFFKVSPIILVAKAIRKQQESSIKWSMMEIRPDETEKAWINFVHRRFAPFAVDCPHIYRSWKLLEEGI